MRSHRPPAQNEATNTYEPDCGLNCHNYDHIVCIDRGKDAAATASKELLVEFLEPI